MVAYVFVDSYINNELPPVMEKLPAEATPLPPPGVKFMPALDDSPPVAIVRLPVLTLVNPDGVALKTGVTATPEPTNTVPVAPVAILVELLVVI
jgi:hypothetical protein